MGTETLTEWIFRTAMLVFLVSSAAGIAMNRSPKFASAMAHGGAFAGSLFAAFAALRVLYFKQDAIISLWNIIPDLQISIRIDPLAAFFLLVIATVTMFVSIYSLGYTTEYFGKKPIGIMGAGLNLFVLSMMTVVTAGNGVFFLLAWELMSLLSFLLVMVEHEKPEVRRAGFVYVVMTHIGTFFISLSFLTLFLAAGSMNFADFAQNAAGLSAPARNLVFLAALIGFGTKAGLLPLHIWLPRAHPAAPSHVSALMSAVMIKTAVYGFLRVCFDFLGSVPVWWGAVILAAGLGSVFFGILYGLAQNDIKRFLAYSSTENMGVIFVGIGASLVFSAYQQPLASALALAASLLHVWNHAIFKSLLFMGAGAVLYATHLRNIEQLGGLIKRMPWTAALFLTGGTAAAALPPFNGFLSEWAAYQSLLHLTFDLDSGWWTLVGGVSVAILGIAGLFAAGGIVKLYGVSFLAMPRSNQAEQAQEVPLSMRIGMGLPAFGALLFGIWPGLSLGVIRGAVSEYSDLTISGSMLFVLPSIGGSQTVAVSPGLLLAVSGLLILFSAVWLRFRFGKNRLHVDETWNCGYPLQPSMEYTGTSFSHPVLMIFQRLYRPQRQVEVQQSHPYVPKRILHRLQIPSQLEMKLYRPAFRLAVQISQRLRTIQNGNLQSYLTYMIVTLIVLLLWIR